MGEGQAPRSDREDALNAQEPERKGPSREELQRRLGEVLRRARAARQAEIAEAAERLRISRGFLEALEAGDWSRLPEEVYARGFARQYAQLLGVEAEVEEILAALRNAHTPLEPPATYPSAPTVPPRRWAQAAAAGFVLLLVLGLWLGGGGDESPSPPPAADTAPAAPAPAEPPATPEPAAPAAPANAPAQAPVETPPPASADAEHGAPLQGEAPQPAGQAAPATADAAPHRYRVVARGGSLWVEFRDPSGALLARKLLADGESLALERPGAVRVRVGDAARAEIRVDGKVVVPAGTLGPPGRVRERLLEPRTPSGQRPERR